MNVITIVTAHTSRLAAAQRLCDLLDARMFLDDGTLGEPGNTRAALAWAEGQDASHVLVIQDDALPVEGFAGLAEAAIDERPNHIISYYLGTGRPAQTEARQAIRLADRTQSRWVEMSRIYWGVAWSIPTSLLPELNAWLSTHNGATDSITGRWMLRTGRLCFYTWPCLVDHLDGPTLVEHTYSGIERKAWRVATKPSALT